MVLNLRRRWQANAVHYRAGDSACPAQALMAQFDLSAEQLPVSGAGREQSRVAQQLPDSRKTSLFVPLKRLAGWRVWYALAVSINRTRSTGGATAEWQAQQSTLKAVDMRAPLHTPSPRAGTEPACQVQASGHGASRWRSRVQVASATDRTARGVIASAFGGSQAPIALGRWRIYHLCSLFMRLISCAGFGVDAPFIFPQP